ncbi:aminoacyl-tRNA hydrolase [Peribacillus deserti]|uniref:Peptidyl-tRNA hydrolase n=1 Tax=Peribacillus deserti TaxID=673318 RepID=A0A2N5M940_9BACI|nr:aminoacyl-tRNA hydrolase [Peribacillus deserti]PLT30870.1 aminoacyl-tRNA hydrolase [Peribacillus deserti]
MKVIIGLGNPGKQFDGTRHNIGFDVIDALSDKWNIPLDQAKHKGLLGTGMVNGEKVLLLKPLTYMNLSGESISAVLNFYKLSHEDIVVIYDDLDLPPGKLRLRQKGSAGGHNGIKSTIAHLGTQEFNRIRVGVGRPTDKRSVPDFVLSRFTKDEQELMSKVVDICGKACENWLEADFLIVMNKFNG